MSSRSSNRKRGKPKNANDDVDRISNLLEPVLSHILSFIPTIEAVATSLVSRRWRFLWRDIHNLRFDDREFTESKIKFVHFVNKVMIFLNRQSIERFWLDIEGYDGMNDISSWIAAAVARNLKMLRFDNADHESSYDDPHPELPSCIFTCRTLEVLELKGNMSVFIPSSVCLPNLKTLILDTVCFRCVDESVRNLISGCPSLTTLHVEREDFDNIVTFSIASHTLTKLVLRFSNMDCPPEFDYKLEVNAPALRYFYLHDELSGDFSIENLGSLEEAIIQTRVFIDDKANYPKAIVKLFQGVSNVKSLILHPSSVKALRLVDTLPSFPRLTRFKAQYCDWSFLLKLTAHMNKLEFLNVTQMKIKNSPSWQIKYAKPPICFLSYLRKMSIDGFRGEDDELSLVAYILKNSKLLKTMIIKAYHGIDPQHRNELLEKVLKFPRGHEECEITLSADEQSY